MGGRALLLAVLVAGAAGHGQISFPKSRNHMCGWEVKRHGASGTACEALFKAAEADGAVWNDWYQHQAVVTHAEGRKKVSPLPKHVCGFDGETWKGGASPWDRPLDWPVNQMQAGRQKFEWDIQWGPHVDDTADFRYWITKPGFQFRVGTEPTWDDFEAEPFCDLSFDGQSGVDISISGNIFTTMCTVPARSGRHIIYGEWGRNPNTYERFHGCVDAMFSGGAGVRPPTASVPAPVYTPPRRTPMPAPVYTPPRRTPMPAPVYTPPQGQPSGKVCRMYDGCKDTPDCCPSGSQCYANNQWYWQCRSNCPSNWACARNGGSAPVPPVRRTPVPRVRRTPVPRVRRTPVPRVPATRPPMYRQPKVCGVCRGGTGCYAKSADHEECRHSCPAGWDCAKAWPQRR